MDYDKLLQAAAGLGRMGASMDPNPHGFASKMGNAGVDAAQAEIMSRQMKKQQEKEEKAKKAGVFRKVGSALGTVAGSMIPNVGPIVGPAVGAAIGGTAGTVAGGGDLDFRNILMDAAMGGAAGVMGRMRQGAEEDEPDEDGAEAITGEEEVQDRGPEEVAGPRGLVAGVTKKDLALDAIRRYALAGLLLRGGIPDYWALLMQQDDPMYPVTGGVY